MTSISKVQVFNQTPFRVYEWLLQHFYIMHTDICFSLKLLGRMQYFLSYLQNFLSAALTKTYGFSRPKTELTLDITERKSQSQGVQNAKLGKRKMQKTNRTWGRCFGPMQMMSYKNPETEMYFI